MYEDDQEARKASNELFKLLDNDKSGMLDQKELRRARTIMLCRGDTGDDVKDMTSNFGGDADGDGDGKVSKDEWHNFVGSLYAVVGKKQFMSLARYWISNTGGQQPGKTAMAKKKTAAAGLDAGDAELVAAAKKIQSATRGNQARKHVKTMAESKCKSDQSAAPANHGPERITATAELWERLTVDVSGRIVTSIEVHDFIDFFTMMKRSGLDLELASTIPMRALPEGDFQPEDLSAGEVAHLCVALMSNPDLDEETARREIEPIREECRAPEAQGQLSVHMLESDAGAFKLRRFKRWCSLLSALMRVDEDYVVTLLLWHRAQQFEIPEKLLVEILKSCMGEEVAREWARTVSEGGLRGIEEFQKNLLLRPFGLNEWMRFVYRAQITDQAGQTGIPYGPLQAMFAKVCQQVTKLMEQRAADLKWRTSKEFTKDPGGLVGRHEIGILMQDLWKTPPVRNLFASPLHMAVRLVQRARNNSLVEPPKNL